MKSKTRGVGVRVDIVHGADGAPLIVRLVDLANAGRTGAKVAIGTIEGAGVAQWWRVEEGRALTRDWTDARDILLSARNAGLRAVEDTARGVSVAPEDGGVLRVDSPQIVGEFAWAWFQLEDPDCPGLVALPPATWADETARRAWKWARKLGAAAIGELGFWGAVRELNELVRYRGVELRIEDESWRVAPTFEDCPF